MLAPTGSMASVECEGGWGGPTIFPLKICHPLFWPRHCISSLSLSPGSQNSPDEDLLAPEACYECKINSLPSRDRPRRSMHGDRQVPEGMHYWVWWYGQWWGQAENGPRVGTPDSMFQLVPELWCLLGLSCTFSTPRALWGTEAPSTPPHFWSQVKYLLYRLTLGCDAPCDPFHGTWMQKKGLGSPNPASTLELITPHLLAGKTLPQAPLNLSSMGYRAASLSPLFITLL